MKKSLTTGPCILPQEVLLKASESVMGEIEGVGRDEDALAFCRIEREYQNLLICELPNGDFAQTILRQFYFSSFMLLFWEQAQNSSDDTVAAVAGKAIKEAKLFGSVNELASSKSSNFNYIPKRLLNSF